MARQTSQPTLFHAPQSRARTTLWMNEELGAPCKVELIDIKKGGQKAPEYLTVNPMGKVPALVDAGVTTTEVAAICAYLADKYSDKGLAPAQDAPERGAYFRWMFFAPSCIEPTMLDIFTKADRPNPMSIGHGAVEDVFKAIDHALENGPFLLGETFSAADVVFGSTLNFAMSFGAFEKKDAYVAYVERLTSRAAYKSTEQKEARYTEQLGWA